MGLDIVAYSKLIRSDDQSDEGGYDGIRIWRDSFGYCELEEGQWESTQASQHHSFRVGSYSSYNQFRDDLCRAIHGVSSHSIYENLEDYDGAQFIGLINFSDCDGMIGPEVSGILYRNFVENRERFIRNISDYPDFSKETLDPIALETEFPIEFGLSPNHIEYYIGLYDDFMLAFEIASDGGVVQFC